MFRLFLFGFSLLMVHVGMGEFWKMWVPFLTDSRPLLLNVTYGEVCSGINRSLIAPMAQGFLDLASRSPLWPDHVASFARWLIGG